MWALKVTTCTISTTTTTVVKIRLCVGPTFVRPRAGALLLRSAAAALGRGGSGLGAAARESVHSVFAVVGAQHQCRDSDVGPVGGQLALENRAELLAVEVLPRVLHRVEVELNHSLRRGGEQVVV